MYYIVLTHEGELEKVWAHHGVNGASKGCWARDFDARYADHLFGYRDGYRAAVKGAQLLRTLSQHGMSIDLLKRRELFELLGVDDWSGGR